MDNEPPAPSSNRRHPASEETSLLGSRDESHPESDDDIDSGSPAPDRHRFLAILAAAATVMVCLGLLLGGNNTASVRSTTIGASLVSENENSIVEALAAELTGLENLSPEQQELQVLAYQDFKNGMSVEDLNTKYDVGVANWFECCKPGGTDGCREIFTDMLKCEPSSNCQYTNYGLTLTSECCQRTKIGRKFWAWGDCE